MNYGLYYKFDVKSGEITAIEQNPMTKNSVAVSFLTIETSLAEGQFLEVTFGKFDNNAYTVLTPALGFISINANPETYQTAIPDLIFKESGKYAFSLSVKTPVVQSDGTTDYAVLTSVQAGFTVDNTIAVISHNPLTPTEVDTINAELAAISKRVSVVESKLTNTVVVDFSVNEETGVATIIYNNGTTKTVQLPLETIDAVYQTGLVTVLNFTADSWEGDINSGYILAFGAPQTGQSDKNFIVQLCAEGTESYKTGSETTASAKQGDYTRADTVFKGSDGSLLLYSNTKYGGSLVVIGGELKAAIVQEAGNATDKAMSQKAVTDELNKKISNPAVSGNKYNLVTFNGEESGILPYTNEPTPSSVVQRDANGRTQAEDGIGEKDVVNLGQLSAGYAKKPEYVLIEKVITGYTVLETAPEDFTTNYASYYKTNGKARNDIDFNYVALTEAETFETGKYYSKAGAEEYSKVNRSSGIDGSAYSFSRMKIFTQNEVNKIRQWSSLQIYINNSDISSCTCYFNTSQTATMADVNVYIDGNSIFTTNTLVSSELYGYYNLVTNRFIFDDNNIKITKFGTGNLFTDTTLLIYGVRI